MSASTIRPAISIVTPSLNQAAFLSEALASVQSQGDLPVEHLVLDGGSTDGSQQILRAFDQSCHNDRFWWRSSPDTGQSSALNEGFAMAKGQIVGWLNADDRYRPGCFEAVIRAFAEHPEIDVVYGDYTFIDANGRHLALRREIDFSRFVLRYHKVLYIPTTATFFRRRIFEEGNALSTSLHYAMDLEFFLRLAEAGYRFHHLREVLSDFRIHPSSKSVAFRERQLAEHRSVILQTTPLARRFKSPLVRGLAVDVLKVPAAAMRYGEKLLRGYYFPVSQPQTRRCVATTVQEKP